MSRLDIGGYNSWNDVFKNWNTLSEDSKQRAWNFLNHDGSMCYIGERWGYTSDYQGITEDDSSGCKTCSKLSYERFGRSSIIYHDDKDYSVKLNKTKLKTAITAVDKHWNKVHTQ